MEQLFKPIRQALSFLDNPVVFFVLRLALVLYVITLLPKVSEDIVEFVLSPIGKLIILLLVMTVYVKDQSLALLFTIVLLVTLLDYEKRSFPAIVVDTSGQVIGNVIRGTSDVVAELGETGAKLVGVAGKTTEEVVKSVGKGAAKAVGVIGSGASEVVRGVSEVSGQVVGDVAAGVQQVGTIEEFSGCGSCGL